MPSGPSVCQHRDDMTLGEGGMRWVTLGAKGQPDLSLALMVPGPPTMDPASAQQMKALIAKGVLGAGAFHTDDCEADYERFSARGVTFVQKPEKRPYGVEAVFRDDSGCWYSLTQPAGRLDETASWAIAFPEAGNSFSRSEDFGRAGPLAFGRSLQDRPSAGPRHRMRFPS